MALNWGMYWSQPFSAFQIPDIPLLYVTTVQVYGAWTFYVLLITGAELDDSIEAHRDYI